MSGKRQVNPTLYVGVIIVTFALLFYSIAVITEQRKSLISKRVLLFLTAGVTCDVSTTTIMIIGSRNMSITIHGLIGYSALVLMLLDTVMVWRFWAKNGSTSKVSHGFHIYTRIAYGWWVVAYVAGGIIAARL